MPRRVDHDRRRAEIADAVWRIAAAQGLEAVSIRTVAAEAGISPALVQRYFPDKDILLRSALEALSEQGDRRARERVAARLPPAGDPAYERVLVRAVLDECLPLDEQRRTTLLVHQAFFTRMRVDTSLAAWHRDAWPQLVRLIADHLSQAQRNERAVEAFDPDRDASLLLTLAAGLGTEMLAGVRTAADTDALIEYHLDRLFT